MTNSSSINSSLFNNTQSTTLPIRNSYELCKNSFSNLSSKKEFNATYFKNGLNQLDDQGRFRAFVRAFKMADKDPSILNRLNQIFNGLSQDLKLRLFGENIQGDKTALFFELNNENQALIQQEFLNSFSPIDRKIILEQLIKEKVGPNNQFAPLFASGRPFTAFTPPGAKSFFESVTHPSYATSKHLFTLYLDPSSNGIMSFNKEAKCTEQMVLDRQCLLPQLKSVKIACETLKNPGQITGFSQATSCKVTLNPQKGAQVASHYTLPEDSQALSQLLKQNAPDTNVDFTSPKASQEAFAYAQNKTGVHFLESLQATTTKVRNAAYQIFNPLATNAQVSQTAESTNSFADKMEFSTSCDQKIINGTAAGPTFCQYEMKLTQQGEIIPWHQRVWQHIVDPQKNEVIISATSSATVNNYQALFSFIGESFSRKTAYGKEIIQFAPSITESDTPAPQQYWNINSYLNKMNDLMLTHIAPTGAGILIGLHSAKFLKKAATKDSVSLGRRVAGVFVGAIGMLAGFGIAYERLSHLQVSS